MSRGRFFDPRGALIRDYSGAPGPTILKAGSREAGFYGFTTIGMFPNIDPANGDEPFNTTNFLDEIEVDEGTIEYGDHIPWLKFSWKGKILFVPLKPLRRSISWNYIYEKGCVYGTGDQGILPPNGRAGHEISIVDDGGTFKVHNSSGDTTADPGDETGWLHPDAPINEGGNTLVMAGWANEENNGEFTIDSIDDEDITLVETGLVAESGNLDARIWNKDKEVDQDKQVTIGDHTYKVRLLRGAGNDPADYGSNRGQDDSTDVNEWARLIFPLHINALAGNWNYNYYDMDTVPNWNIGLTDEDLITHHSFGNGGYSWTQESRGDDESFRRLLWGSFGTSHVIARASCPTHAIYGFRPALELIP